MTGLEGRPIIVHAGKKDDCSLIPPRLRGIDRATSTMPGHGPAWLGCAKAPASKQPSNQHDHLPNTHARPSRFTLLPQLLFLLDVLTTFFASTVQFLPIAGPPLPQGSTFHHKLLIPLPDEVAAYTSPPWPLYLSSSPSCSRYHFCRHSIALY